MNKIAIIGAACRLPGNINSLDDLWDFLVEKRDAITKIGQDRWDSRRFCHPEMRAPGRTYTNAAGLLENIEKFDAAFFGMTDQEAAHLDPQQRLMLEMTWEAFEDAGIPPSSVAGTNAAVCFGTGSQEMGAISGGDPCSFGPYSIFGATLSIIANRVSYFFDLHGPSLTTDTACSSSLTALHLANGFLINKDASLAVVGGINCVYGPVHFALFSKAGMLSPDGSCRVFDSSANGYVRAEGGGIVILKRLEDALKDRDRIHGVIVASDVNSDGKTTGIALPNQKNQENLLRSLYVERNIDPRRLAYVEAHGTGTKVGDPIEANSIGNVLGKARPQNEPLYIGSIKSNIGHLEIASGMAGLLKAILVLKNREIPPNIHFTSINPEIDADNLNIRVVSELSPFLKPNDQTIVGVNSFGFGGTNAHVILGHAPQADEVTKENRSFEKPPPLFISAKTEDSLRALAEAYAARLEDDPELPIHDLAAAAAMQRDHLTHRLIVTGKNKEDVINILKSVAKKSTEDERHSFVDESLWIGRTVALKGQTAFAFSGNGCQWPGMGRQLIEKDTVFTDTIRQVDEILSQFQEWSVLKELKTGCSEERIDHTDVAQPLLFALQIGLYESLKAKGLVPHAVYGHSVGEIAAAYASGALTLEDACMVVHFRSTMQENTRGLGRMAAINISLEKAEEFVAANKGKIELAAINASNSVTLAGDINVLEKICEIVNSEKGWGRLLEIKYPFHSNFMDSIEESIRTSLKVIKPQEADIPFISTTTGLWMDGRELDSDYWWRNIRYPVRFHSATDYLLAQGTRFFLEVGANGILQFYLMDAIKARNVVAWRGSTLRRDVNDRFALHKAWRAAYAAGWEMKWDQIFPDAKQHVELPKYCWDRARHWIQHTPEDSGIYNWNLDHPLLGCRVSGETSLWENTIDNQLFPWMAGHTIEGVNYFPAAGFLEICLAVGRDLFQECSEIEVINADIRHPLVIGSVPGTKIRTSLTTDGMVRIDSRPLLSKENWTLHAKARITKNLSPPPPKVDIAGIISKGTEVKSETIYSTIRKLGYTYEDPFQAIGHLWESDGIILSRLILSDPEAGHEMLLPPPILDSIFQSSLWIIAKHLGTKQPAVYLPTWTGKMQLFSDKLPVYGISRLLDIRSTSITADFDLLDDKGHIIARLLDCRSRRIFPPKSNEKQPAVYTYKLRPTPHPKSELRSDILSPAEIKTCLVPKLHELFTKFHRSIYYDQVLPFKQAATIALAYEIIRPLAKFNKVVIDNLIESDVVKPEYIPYIRYVLGLLEESELAFRNEGEWCIKDSVGLPPSILLGRTFIADYPIHLPDALLLGRLGLHIQELLRGEASPDSILDFNPGAAMEQYYSNSPSLQLVNEAVKELVRQVYENLPEGKRLRILELGAAPGSILTAVQSILDPVRCDYIVTDNNEESLNILKACQGHADNLSFLVLDIEQPRLDEIQKFDLILAGHVLHETDAIHDALRNCLHLLKPGGLLVIIERSPCRLVELTQGIQTFWWSLSTSSMEPVPRLVSQKSWCDMCRAAGFEDISIISEPCQGVEPDCFMVVGRKPLDVGETSELTVTDDSPLWLIFSDADHSSPGAVLGRKVKEHLENAGAATLLVEANLTVINEAGKTIESETIEYWTHLLSNIEKNRRIECVHLLGFDTNHFFTTKYLEFIQRIRVSTATTFVQAWEQLGQPAARLWLLTGGGFVALNGDRRPKVTQASMIGFGRVLMNEALDLDVRLIDISDPNLSNETIQSLLREFLNPTDEREIVIDGDDRYSVRLYPIQSISHLKNGRETPEAIELAFDIPGKLDNLYWRHSARPNPGPGEVQVQVVAIGLNFRDVLWTLGIIPDEALENGFTGPTLGLECSGVVTNVGPDTKNLKVGDEVICLAPACFSSHITTLEITTIRKPPSLTHEEAATIPVAFFTAYYALKYLARLEPGEKVLIHGAAGGVGLAAIQIASHLDLEIFATAGSKEKRDFIRMLGIEHVLDSRSLRFVEDIIEITGGEGIDAVLNSLSGDYIEKGISILKPFGRFLELGKRDFYEDTPMFLRPFRNNISYFGVDVDQLLATKPGLCKTLLNELWTLFGQGLLRPLPHRVFPRINTIDAFRKMQQSQHIGKLVVQLNEYRINVPPKTNSKSELPLKPKATYLVTGGLGGLGLKTVERLGTAGGKHFVLLGRSGASSPEAAEVVEKLESRGCIVKIVQVDVSQKSALDASLDRALNDMPPLRGVVHSAAVLSDAVILNQSPQRYAEVLAPKAVGAWNLHTYTEKMKLDFFIMYSSSSAVFGNPGQANYAAANLSLESLAGYRRSMGLPALTVGWGPISDVGMLSRDPETLEMMKQVFGFNGFSSSKALDFMEKIFWLDTAYASVFSVNWRKVKRSPLGDHLKFHEMLKNYVIDDTSEGMGLEFLTEMKPNEAINYLGDVLIDKIASLLRIPAVRLDRNMPLVDLGMDSLMAVELGLSLEERLGFEIPMISIGRNATIKLFAERIYARIINGNAPEDDKKRVAESLQMKHAVKVNDEFIQNICKEINA